MLQAAIALPQTWVSPIHGLSTLAAVSLGCDIGLDDAANTPAPAARQGPPPSPPAEAVQQSAPSQPAASGQLAPSGQLVGTASLAMAGASNSGRVAAGTQHSQQSFYQQREQNWIFFELNRVEEASAVHRLHLHHHQEYARHLEASLPNCPLLEVYYMSDFQTLMFHRELARHHRGCLVGLDCQLTQLQDVWNLMI